MCYESFRPESGWKGCADLIGVSVAVRWQSAEVLTDVGAPYTEPTGASLRSPYPFLNLVIIRGSHFRTFLTSS